MSSGALATAVSRQLRSRFRSATYRRGAVAPVLVIGILLLVTAQASDDSATLMFLAILSTLWIGGSACVREVVDERPLVEREPHLALLGYGAAKVLHALVVGSLQSLIVAVFVWSSGVVSLPLADLWVILALTAASGLMLALILSALCDEPATALAWFPLLLVPQVVFGGFLFPFGPTEPFGLDPVAGIVEMPAALVRHPVDGGVVQLAGSLCVTRWALEAYAAKIVEQDLGDKGHLTEAIRVTSYVPVTLSDAPIPQRLRARSSKPTTGAVPADLSGIDAHSRQYLLVLVAFVVAQAAIFVAILPARDPRRG